MTTMSRTATPPASAWRRLLVTEAKLFLREPMAVFWGVVFPLILTIAMGLAGDRHDKQLGGASLVTVYVPISMAMVMSIMSVQMLPVILSSYREKGILRRMSTTPVRPLALLAADVAVNVAVIACAMAVIVIVARIAFNVSLPSQVFGFALTLVLTAVAMLSLGAVVATWKSRSRASVCTRRRPTIRTPSNGNVITCEGRPIRRSSRRTSDRVADTSSRSRSSTGPKRCADVSRRRSTASSAARSSSASSAATTSTTTTKVACTVSCTSGIPAFCRLLDSSPL